MVIDAHVHYTPPSLAADLDAFAEQEPFWGLMLAPRPDGRSVQGWATAERMIEDMDAAGISQVMLMGEYRRSHAACVARNDEALALVRRWPDRILAFAMIQPKAGRAALLELARCLDAGMVGVGELGPYGQGYRLDDPDFLRLAEACADRGVPVNLHTNEEVGRFYPGKATTPLRDYYQLAVRFPELKLILAHWGGGLPFFELMPEVRRALRNVWYDTAASPLMYPSREIFEVALRCVDHRKILFGSDYPLLLYPRRQAEPDFRPFRREIEDLGLAPEVQEAIFGANVKWLLGDHPPETAAASTPGFGLSRSDRVAPVLPITAATSTLLVAEAWPETRAIFESRAIPTEDSPVPFWEPIAQAAAARGIGGAALDRLLVELNEAAAQDAASSESGRAT
jgi:predicted TIM-barrel fold metal-dependent hydrolase